MVHGKTNDKEITKTINLGGTHIHLSVIWNS